MAKEPLQIIFTGPNGGITYWPDERKPEAMVTVYPQGGMMARDEFAAKMRKIWANNEGGADCTHFDADKLMCDLLRQLGYGEGVDVFEQATAFKSRLDVFKEIRKLKFRQTQRAKR